MFETHFLQNGALRWLTISVVGPKNKELKLRFSMLNAATSQEMEPIDYLSDNQIYHLRAQHPAIDGVCIGLDSNSKRYLLLLQVSLSEYKHHTSKGIHIRRHVPKSFEGRFCKGGIQTIAEYYRCIANVGESEVIYVYISPHEIQEPNADTFNLELTTRIARFGAHLPKYLYGFCLDDGDLSKVIILVNSNILYSHSTSFCII